MKTKRIIFSAFIVTLFSLIACNTQIDESTVERRAHGLSYLKGTNTLVDGEVVRKVEGEIVEIHNYSKGKMVGEYFQYGPNGKVATHGFGVEIKKYEKELNGFDLTNCILSIVQVKNDFGYATLYMDNVNLFNDNNKIIALTKSVLAEYGEKYKIEGLLIFDNYHEYSVAKSATMNSNFKTDTVRSTNLIKVNFR